MRAQLLLFCEQEIVRNGVSYVQFPNQAREHTEKRRIRSNRMRQKQGKLAFLREVRQSCGLFLSYIRLRIAATSLPLDVVRRIEGAVFVRTGQNARAVERIDLQCVSIRCYDVRDLVIRDGIDLPVVAHRAIENVDKFIALDGGIHLRRRIIPEYIFSMIPLSTA